MTKPSLCGSKTLSLSSSSKYVSFLLVNNAFFLGMTSFFHLGMSCMSLSCRIGGSTNVRSTGDKVNYLGIWRGEMLSFVEKFNDYGIFG